LRATAPAALEGDGDAAAAAEVDAAELVEADVGRDGLPASVCDEEPEVPAASVAFASPD